MTGPLKPLVFDAHPRYCEATVPHDPSENGLYQALKVLRGMAKARGYVSRDLEFQDCTFVCSERWLYRSDELRKALPGLKVQTVTPALLKTEAAWALVWGIDSYVSTPTW